MAEDLLHVLLRDATLQESGGRLSSQVVKVQVGDLRAHARLPPPVLDGLGHPGLAELVPEDVGVRSVLLSVRSQPSHLEDGVEPRRDWHVACLSRLRLPPLEVELAHGAAVWLTDTFVRTKEARARLAAWLDEGGLDRAAPDVREAVGFYGDDPMLAPVVDAICCLPPPARDFVLDTATIVGTGWSTRGWTGSSNFASKTPRLIALSGATRDPETITHVTLHETAHVWLEPIPAALITSAGKVGLTEHGIAAGWIDQMQEYKDRVEIRAETLTSEWERQAKRRVWPRPMRVRRYGSNAAQEAKPDPDANSK